MSENKKVSLFLKRMGDSSVMKILEIFIESRGLEFSKQDLVEFTGLARNTVYAAWSGCVENGYIVHTKKVGNITLYTLNEEDSIIKKFVEIFDGLIEEELGVYNKKSEFNFFTCDETCDEKISDLYLDYTIRKKPVLGTICNSLMPVACTGA